jgi:integrase
MPKAKPIPCAIGLIRTRTRADGTTAYRATWDVKDHHGVWKQHSRTFDALEAAQDFLAGIAKAKRDGRYRGPTTITVSELIAEYIDRAGASGRLTERSVLTYRQRAETMIAPTIGKRKLDSISPLDVQRWIDALVRQGFAATTIHPAIAVLMGALREAALLGITDRHLGQGIRRPSIDRTPKATWTTEDVRRVLAAVDGDPIYNALYLVAAMTGMRPGELKALKWADVNLDTGLIIVRRTITLDTDGKEIIADRTKGKRQRVNAITAPVIEKLRWHRVEQTKRRLMAEQWHDLDLVFDRGDGHWLIQSTWQKWQTKLSERVGVPKITHHGLRHSSASIDLETGTHPRVVSDRLGHSHVSMTLDQYSHVSPKLQRSAADALSDLLFRDEDAG